MRIFRNILNSTVLNSNLMKFLNLNWKHNFNSEMSCNIKLDLEVNRIVWIDMEMTGLDIAKDSIMEIACIVTDSNLNIIAEGPNIIINTSDEKLSSMDDWCTKQHEKTGLAKACRESKISLDHAENVLSTFVQQHVTEKCSPMAGNSVYMDRLFLRKYMPRFDSYLHYRIIDTSTIKELCRRWNENVHSQAPKKKYTHRALNDIKESIEELRYYKYNFFNVVNHGL